MAAAPIFADRIAALSSRRPDHRDWLRKTFPEAKVVDTPQQVVDASDVIFMTTNDGAIRSVCDDLLWGEHQQVIHCSGVLGPEALASAHDAGAATAMFHPLQTFPSLATPKLLARATYAIDCDDAHLSAWLKELVEELGGRHITIRGYGQHVIYHASAVLACGLLAGLVGVAADLWQAIGIGRQDAVALLSPMLISTVDQIANDGLPAAMSGPFVRGDVETIGKHLAATSELSHDTSRAYAALALAQLHIASAKTDLPDDVVAQIKRILSEHLDPK